MAQLKARRVKKTYLALVAGQRRGARSGGSRRRSGATRSTGPGWPSSPTAGRPTTGYRVRERFAGWTLLELDLVTGPDPPDPRPPRRDRPPGRRRPGLRHRDVAPRPGRPRAAVPARLAARAHLAVERRPDPGRGAAPRRARAGPRRAAGATRPGGDAGDDRLVERSRPIRAGRTASSTAPRARCSSSSRARPGVGQGHDHRRAPRRAPSTTRDARYYVVTCTTRPPRTGEVDGVHYHFLTPRRVPARCATPAASSRRTRSTATGTARRATRSATALAAGRDVDPQDRRPGRRGRQGAGPRGAAGLPRPAVARGPLLAAPGPGDRDRRRARHPPAQRRARARPPGRLRPRRRRTRPARSSGRPSGSTRSSPTRTAAHPDRRMRV